MSTSTGIEQCFLECQKLILKVACMKHTVGGLLNVDKVFYLFYLRSLSSVLPSHLHFQKMTVGRLIILALLLIFN